jgi:hypothetical protein
MYPLLAVNCAKFSRDSQAAECASKAGKWCEVGSSNRWGGSDSGRDEARRLKVEAGDAATGPTEPRKHSRFCHACGGRHVRFRVSRAIKACASTSTGRRRDRVQCSSKCDSESAAKRQGVHACWRAEDRCRHCAVPRPSWAISLSMPRLGRICEYPRTPVDRGDRTAGWWPAREQPCAETESGLDGADLAISSRLSPQSGSLPALPGVRHSAGARVWRC